MNTELKLEFPEFITHIPKSKKEWIKIGYNKIHANIHFSTRASLVAAMHGYIEKHIPENLSIETPISTHLIVYVPINFGTVKLITTENSRKINWKPPHKNYLANWDIGNLAWVWIKSLDDVLIKKGILPDDNIRFLKKTTYEFQPVEKFTDRKLVYCLKTIK